jgi:hypothetical protein
MSYTIYYSSKRNVSRERRVEAQALNNPLVLKGYYKVIIGLFNVARKPPAQKFMHIGS